MLTDTAIKALKRKEKIYKVTNRDGMYVRVDPSGTVQEWADIVDAWVEGRKHVPTLLPPALPLVELSPAL